MQITTIGLDIPRTCSKFTELDAAEKVVVRKQLRRSQVLAFFKAASAGRSALKSSPSYRH